MKLTPEQVLTGIGLTLAASIAAPVVTRTVSNTANTRLRHGIWGIATVPGGALSTLLVKQMKSANAFVKEEVEDFFAEVNYERQQICVRRTRMMSEKDSLAESLRG